MPKVTQEHLDARRQQIVDAARRCFLREGFHATTMQDVLAEAGLSAGAVYRYFRGKDEIVIAAAEDVFRQIGRVADEALIEDPLPPLADVVQQLLETVQRIEAESQMLVIGVQVWGEALRNPTLHSFAEQFYTGVRGYCTELARRAQRSGQLDPGADPEQVGQVLFALLPGFIVQSVLLGDVSPKPFADGLRALTRTSVPQSGSTIRA